MSNVRNRVYLPAISARQSELKAVDGLSQMNLDKTLPLIKTNGDAVNAYDQLSKNLRTSSSLSLLIDIGNAPDPPKVNNFINTFRNQKNHMYGFSIPKDTAIPELNSMILNSSGGFSAIRLKPEEIINVSSTVQRLQTVYQAAKKVQNNIDISLILDFGHLSDSQSVVLNEKAAASFLAAINASGLNWNRIFVLSGSFPRQITKIAPDTVTTPPAKAVKRTIPRLELDMFNHLRALNLVKPEILFGDYSIFNAEGISNSTNLPFTPAPNIRYTQPSEWILLRGKRKNNRGFYTLCSQLKTLCPVDSASFSTGDYIFNTRNAKSGGPGGATQWLEWNSSHHLAFTIRQLSNSGVI